MSKKRARSRPGQGSDVRRKEVGRKTAPWREWCLYFVPACIAFVVWMDSLRNGFVWDDRILVVENSSLSAPGAILRAFGSDFWAASENGGTTNYYRPIVTVSYVMDHALYGSQAWGFHLTNVVIHAINCALLMVLLVILGMPQSVAMVSAILFGVHPALGESIAWVSGRTDSMCVLWMLVTLIASRMEVIDSYRPQRWRWLGAVSFAFALGSKELAIVTPVVSYVFARYLGHRHPSRVAFSAPYILVFVGWCLLRSVVLSGSLSLVGISSIGIWSGLLFLSHVMGNLVLPSVFRVEYGSLLRADAVVGGAVAGGIVVFCAAMNVMRGATRTKSRTYPLSVLLCAAGLLMCVPGVLAVYVKSVIGTRLAYGPAVFLVPAGLVAAQSWLSQRRVVTWGVVLAMCLAPLSVMRARLWRSDITLFQQALLAPYPSTRVHLNLGIALYDGSRLVEAKAHLEKEMERGAQDQQHYMLGLLYTLLGCEEKAEKHYRQSLAINPAYPSSTANLVGLLVSQGKRAEAQSLIADLATRARVAPNAVRTIQNKIKLVGEVPLRAPEARSWCATDATVHDFFTSASLLDSRAVELFKAGQMDMAGILFVAAYRLAPTSLDIRLHYAQYLLTVRDNHRAREILHGILYDYPGSAPAQKLLSSIQ